MSVDIKENTDDDSSSDPPIGRPGDNADTECTFVPYTSSQTLQYNRKIIIGDVHGCYDELMLLLKNVEYNSDRDQLYFVGDLVVKGPKSNQVIEFIRNTKNTFCVLGNHDYSLLRAALYIKYGINEISSSSFKICSELDQAHPPNTLITHQLIAKTISIENIKYLANLPLYLYSDKNQNILIVHAGIIPNQNIQINKQRDHHLMTLRNVINLDNRIIGTNKQNVGKKWISCYNGFNGHIFFGHDAPDSLQISKYGTGLDTGCCYGGKLTAAIIKCDNDFNLFNDFEIDELGYKTMKWEFNASIYTSSTKLIFKYRIYQETALKTYVCKTIKKPNAKNTSITLQAIDNLISLILSQ